MKKACVFVVFAVAACAALAVEVKKPAKPVEKPKSAAELATEPKVFVCRDGAEFLYRWHAPAKAEPGKKYPLVITLHGSGERGTNNVAQLSWGVTPLVNWAKSKKQEFFLIAGQCPANDMWTALRTVAASQPMEAEPTRAMAHQMELIESVLSGDLPVDRDRVYVTGLSMGGYGTWDLISRKPEWFAAAMPVCGGGDPKQVAKLVRLPIFIHHGADDGNVAPWNSRLMYLALVMAGSNSVRYNEYPGCGHPSWRPAYDNPKNFDWLFAQRRLPAPDWKAATVEKTPNGAIKIVPPGPRYEVEFLIGVSGQPPVKVVGRRAGQFPIVTIGGHVVEGAAFDFSLTGNQVLISNRKGGHSFDFSEFRIRALAKGER